MILHEYIALVKDFLKENENDFHANALCPLFRQIMTTGLAGGLTQPYKGMMPAALEAP